MSKIYSVNNIKKSYGKKIVFNNLSFSISDKEMVGIFGSSGSGKTTLISILGLLDSKYSGEYIFNGKVIKKTKDKDLTKTRRSNIGFVFQESV